MAVNLNAYAAITPTGLLWVARIGLLGAVVVHIGAATSLTLRSAAARPAGYKKKVWLGNDYPARTMRWGGVIVLAFVIYHLAHLTLGVTGPAVQPCSDASGEMVCHVYDNVLMDAAFPSPLSTWSRNSHWGCIWRRIWSGFALWD